MSDTQIEVIMKVRPLIKDEERECIKINENEVRIEGRDENFTFDNVFQNGQQLYDEEVKPLLIHFFNGMNLSILAYGQTGSGKTFTMGTSGNICSHEQKDSVIVQVMKDINKRIHDDKESDFVMKVSFIEVIRSVQQ